MKRLRFATDDFEERFIPEPNSGCWLWIGNLSKKGYGVFGSWRKQTLVSAHRYAYERFVGPIPDGLQIDHLCRVRCCVNPAHMEPVTNRENAQRGSVGAAARERFQAMTTCRRGHLLNHAPGTNWRRCKECYRLWCLTHPRKSRAKLTRAVNGALTMKLEK